MPENAKGNILEVTDYEQYRAVDELLEKSHENSIYYTLLGLSSIVIASGLILENGPIVIGGAIVAPTLIPILVIALGLAVGELHAIKKALFLVVKSSILVILCSAVMALLFGLPRDIIIFENSARAAILYFLVAVSSGVAATFAWARRDISEALPGVAIAVSLEPPLALVGILAVSLSIESVRFFSLVFLFNIFGIVVGSLVVFSLLKFYRAKIEVEKKTKEP